jgi:hypothetical protein
MFMDSVLAETSTDYNSLQLARQYYEDHGQNRGSWERLVLFVLHIHHHLFTAVH